MGKDIEKILFCCTEDWFFESHFLPLNEATLSLGPQVKSALISTAGDARKRLEANGLKVIPVEFSRRSLNPLVTLKLLWRLIRIIRREKPAIIHFISLKPCLIGGLAALFSPAASQIFHVTGLGTIAEGTSKRAKLFRYIGFTLLTLFLRRINSRLIVENPDDLEFLNRYGKIDAQKVLLFGGAGVDPTAWPQLPQTSNKTIRIGFVGRMILTKGVDVLVEAAKLLIKRQVKFELDLYGDPDKGNLNDISKEELTRWDQNPQIIWHGATRDVQSVWRSCDICVISTRTREGMPRAMLEAAASGRCLVVTDIPGCRHFVRNNIEGFIVPPQDPDALANALEALINDASLRETMGNAARQRVLEGYTEAHVREKSISLYSALLSANDNA